MNRRSQLFVTPPRWRPTRKGTTPFARGLLGSWLYEPGSLTQRLQGLYGARFRVVLVNQTWAKPWIEESRALGLTGGQQALVREVLLQNGDEPVIAARSVIPKATLQGADRRLSRLGTRPLGQILFANPRLQKCRLDITQVPPAYWREQSAMQPVSDRTVWGRRSLYQLGHEHRLLVAEFFLPSLLTHA